MKIGSLVERIGDLDPIAEQVAIDLGVDYPKKNYPYTVREIDETHLRLEEVISIHPTKGTDLTFQNYLFVELLPPIENIEELIMKSDLAKVDIT